MNEKATRAMVAGGSNPKTSLPTPNRVQRRRTAGWRMPAGAIYVGRPSRWGNPFDGRLVGRSESVWLFEQTLIGNADPLAVIRRELAGRDLACWCPLDQPCHADVLIRHANAVEAEQ